MWIGKYFSNINKYTYYQDFISKYLKMQNNLCMQIDLQIYQ